MNRTVLASSVASFLGTQLIGMESSLDSVCSISNPRANCLMFISSFDEATVLKLELLQNIFVIASEELADKLRIPHVISKNPRLDYARVAKEFFFDALPVGISEKASIASSARMGSNVFVADFVCIGEDVVIGDDCRIHPNVVINNRCIIGHRTTIRSNSVIGEEGFGFEFDEDGRPLRLPHLGRVVIGNDVEIGALNVIARGTLDDTFISDFVKTDDHVFIAHNVFVGENSFLIAGACVCGSVKIGNDVWVSPNSTVIQKVEIGDNAMVGIGAVVIKSVETGAVVVGNPARKISDRSNK